MRDIKLRFWDKENKSMVYQDNKCLYPFNIYKIICDLFTNFEFRLFILKDNNLNQFEEVESIKMQFTGLKDKNGIEIYEGDIVKFLDDEIYYSECGTEYDEFENIGQVIYDEEMLAFDINNRNIDRESVWETKLEIIGNIYENPDILEER